jgi:adenylate kinase
MSARFARDGGPLLVLLGPPGVGKGTQGRMLADSAGLELLSTGDILRTAVREGTPLGKQAREHMDAGRLVPDELIDDMMAEQLGATGGSAILDGYPRTAGQAQALTSTLGRLELELSAAVLFEVSDEEVVRRLSGRRSCPDCGRVYHVEFNPPERADQCDADGGPLIQRADDNPQTIQNRLAVYRRDTQPVADYYRERGLLARVDASGEPALIQSRLHAALDAVLQP